MNPKYPNLLIISHNLFDRTNNVGKTLQSLLSDWPKDSLFSLYFRNEKPNEFYCKSYYLLHDKDIIKTFLTAGYLKCGEIFNEKSNIKKDCSAVEQSFYKVGNNRKPLISLIRDIIWHISPWKNKKLKNWLEEIKVDIILFVPNDYQLAFDVMKYTKQITEARMITYYMDDAFYFKQKTKGLDRYRRNKLLNEGKKCAIMSEKLFTTCDLMSDEYEKLFGLTCVSFNNCVDIQSFIKTEKIIRIEKNTQLYISYIGNLHSNRWKSVIEIGEALDSVNKKLNTKSQFHVFSASNLDKQILNAFTKIESISFEGSITPEDVVKIQTQSDILVHVESFDSVSKASTRLSISTKIFEYLAAGKAIFAYGPQDIASMQYLEDTESSINCYENKQLVSGLEKIIKSENLRKKLGDRGRQFAKNYCSAKKERSRFKNEIFKVLENS